MPTYSLIFSFYDSFADTQEAISICTMSRHPTVSADSPSEGNVSVHADRVLLTIYCQSEQIWFRDL